MEESAFLSPQTFRVPSLEVITIMSYRYFVHKQEYMLIFFADGMVKKLLKAFLPLFIINIFAHQYI